MTLPICPARLAVIGTFEVLLSLSAIKKEADTPLKNHVAEASCMQRQKAFRQGSSLPGELRLAPYTPSPSWPAL